jgi:hypothetical protein
VAQDDLGSKIFETETDTRRNCPLTKSQPATWSFNAVADIFVASYTGGFYVSYCPVQVSREVPFWIVLK